MKGIVAYLNRCCIGLYMLVGLFLMASTAMAQGGLPDLMPVVVNANQGTFEIRNIGNATAKPSQVVVVCSRFDSTTPSTPCAVGLHLPNYIKKWNILSYDIPALRPGARKRIHLFGAGALPRKTGNYATKISVDPSRHIAESNENNNYTRLDTTIKAEKAATSKSPEQKPDLTPVIVDADQGIVQVKNIGRATAKASKLVAKCRIYDSRDVFVRFCTARTYLPNFDANRLTLSYKIPPLKPGESHEIHLLGPDAWPRSSGRYHLKVHVDQGDDVAESSEGDNSTEFTSLYVSHDLTSGSKTAGKKPDLIAIASDPFFGIAYVENKGNTTAKTSKLLLTCDQVGHKGGCPTSRAMEKIYNFTLGGYVIDVPALPAGKVQRVAFPASGLSWGKEKYRFSLTADASHTITESRENNNIVHRTLRWNPGVLRLMASSNGKPVRIFYSIKPSGARSHIANYRLRKSAKDVMTPVEISLPTGEYQLRVKAANIHGVNRYFNVEIKAGKVFAQKVIFKQPGLLNMTVLDDHNKKMDRIYYTINLSGDSQYHVAAEGDGSAPVQVSLLPGSYDLHVYHQMSYFGKLSQYNRIGKSATDASSIMGADEQQVIRGIRVQSGQTVGKKVVFRRIKPGILYIHVLADGKPNQTHVSVLSTKKDSPSQFSVPVGDG